MADVMAAYVVEKRAWFGGSWTAAKLGLQRVDDWACD